MSANGFDSEEEITRNFGARSSANIRHAAGQLPGSELETLGRLMAGQARADRKIEALTLDVQTLTREVHQTGKTVQADRGALAHETAKHSSNRMAALMGALFTLYEITSPYLREIWRQVFHR